MKGKAVKFTLSYQGPYINSEHHYPKRHFENGFNELTQVLSEIKSRESEGFSQRNAYGRTPGLVTVNSFSAGSCGQDRRI
jgi:hypothetical protein